MSDCQTNVILIMSRELRRTTLYSVADPGLLEGGGSDILLRAKRVRIFRSHAHFQLFLRQTTSSTSPIDLFSNGFLLKHSKVSHSSSFLSSIARKAFI